MELEIKKIKKQSFKDFEENLFFYYLPFYQSSSFTESQKQTYQSSLLSSISHILNQSSSSIHHLTLVLFCQTLPSLKENWKDKDFILPALARVEL